MKDDIQFYDTNYHPGWDKPAERKNTMDSFHEIMEADMLVDLLSKGADHPMIGTLDKVGVLLMALRDEARDMSDMIPPLTVRDGIDAGLIGTGLILLIDKITSEPPCKINCEQCLGWQLEMTGRMALLLDVCRSAVVESEASTTPADRPEH